MKIALIRGSYLNKFEGQNFEKLGKDFKVTGFGAKNTIRKNFKFPLRKLWSPLDLPNFPYKLAVLNRLFLGDAMYLYGLEEKLKGFDISHVRETYFHFTQQALDAKAKGFIKKVICTCSETIPFNHETIWNRKNFKTRALKEVDKFHCLTEKAKLCLIKEGCDSKKIVVFPYGIDVNKFQVPSTKYQILNKNLSARHAFPIYRDAGGKSTIKILFVGRLVKEKGVYELLKAFNQLIKDGYKLNLTMIGKGPEKNNLINLIIKYKLPKFITIKTVDYENIGWEYAKADIFCLLSKSTKYWEEYFGMVLLEAMSCGVPIITTTSGAIPEIIGNAGLLCKPGDWQDAYTKIKKLIKDKTLASKLKENGIKRVRLKYDVKNTAKNIEKLYTETFYEG